MLGYSNSKTQQNVNAQSYYLVAISSVGLKLICHLKLDIENIKIFRLPVFAESQPFTRMRFIRYVNFSATFNRHCICKRFLSHRPMICLICLLAADVIFELLCYLKLFPGATCAVQECLTTQLPTHSPSNAFAEPSCHCLRLKNIFS